MKSKILDCILGQDFNNSDILYLSVSINVHVPLTRPPLTQWRIRGQKKKEKERRGSGQVLERCSSNSTLNPSLEVTRPHELGGCGVCGGGRE